MRGEFVRGDGRVLPNNITSQGALEILRRALAATKSYDLFLALGSGIFSPTMTMADVLEPTLGVNGYARQPLAWNSTDWPDYNNVNGEYFIQSKAITFAATGAGFDKGITRPFLVTSLTDPAAQVHCIGAPLPASLAILPSTPVEARTFRYRMFAR